MMFDTKSDAIAYIKSILDQKIEISYYRLKLFLEKNAIEVDTLLLTEQRGRAPLSLVSIDKIHKDGSINLTLNSHSLMNYLPMIYHKKDFLKRYLFGVHAFMLDINAKIVNMESLFRAERSEFIDWLSSWFGITYGDMTDERGKRRVLAHAVELYKRRGTKGYFVRLIKSLVDIDIVIDDNKHSKYNRSRSTDKQRSFTVIIKDKISNDPSEESLKYSIIKNIFEMEKPVNTIMNIVYVHGTAEEQKVKEKVISYANDNSYDYDSKI